MRLRISEACSLLDVDGIRGDIVTNRAAAALAAYEDRHEVTLDDISRIIGLCLGHRCGKVLRCLLDMTHFAGDLCKPVVHCAERTSSSSWHMSCKHRNTNREKAFAGHHIACG